MYIHIYIEPYEAAPEVYYSGWGCSGSPLSGEEDAPSLTSRSATASHTDPPAHMHVLPTDTRTGIIFECLFTHVCSYLYFYVVILYNIHKYSTIHIYLFFILLLLFRYCTVT